MSEVIVGVVKLTFGFFANKIRERIAERLKDADVTDEECRRLIVGELEDIHRKLDGLARKDLLSSFLFLEEGINRLFQSPLQIDSNENTVAESPDQAILPKTASFSDTGLNSPMNEAVTLIKATASLKIRSTERFKSAIESFKLARAKATEAFGNEALSIEDRIQATQFRMMARILENLEDTEASASDCLQYLKQLHRIGAIREIFCALIYGGMKSRFNKTKRLNIAKSVQVMNQILFEFIKKFTKSSLLAVMFAWPTILLGEKKYHPLCGEDRHIEKLGMQVMSLDSDFTFGEEIASEYLSIVNSKGDIVALTQDQRTFKVFERSGQSRILSKVPTVAEEHRASECHVMAMDIDAKDNLYVIAKLESTPDTAAGENKSCNFKLFIFDKNGNKKLESVLPFEAYSISSVCMAIHKDGKKFAILILDKQILHVGNVCVELNSLNFCKRVSLVEFTYVHAVRFSSFDSGTIVVTSLKSVYIYTENGELQRGKIENGQKGHEKIKSVAINHATKRILAKTHQPSGGSLLSFSETGELQDSLCLGFRNWFLFAWLLSHPNGPVALVRKTGATLLQL